ncbi:hypothetical protein D3C73_681790 [compost metagenome]
MAPPKIPANITKGTCMIAGNPGITPTKAAASIPTKNCPSTPILNSPVLNATAFATPVKTKGVR